jgi:hypothetical protein
MARPGKITIVFGEDLTGEQYGDRGNGIRDAREIGHAGRLRRPGMAAARSPQPAQLCTISEPFTAVFALRLVDRGRLGRARLCSSIAPSFAPRRWRVTLCRIRHPVVHIQPAPAAPDHAADKGCPAASFPEQVIECLEDVLMPRPVAWQFP